LKFNNVKLINKAIATEEYLTSVIMIIGKKNPLFCKPTIFYLLVVIVIVMKTKKKEKCFMPVLLN